MDSSTLTWRAGWGRFKLGWALFVLNKENNRITVISSAQLGSNRYEAQIQIFRDRMSPRESCLTPSCRHSPKKPLLGETSSSVLKCNAKLNKTLKCKCLISTEQGKSLQGKPKDLQLPSSWERRGRGQDRRQRIRGHVDTWHRQEWM